MHIRLEYIFIYEEFVRSYDIFAYILVYFFLKKVKAQKKRFLKHTDTHTKIKNKCIIRLLVKMIVRLSGIFRPSVFTLSI